MRKVLYSLALIASLLVSTRSQAQVNANFTINYSVPNCAPSLVTFVNTSTGLAPLTYQWNFGLNAGVNSTLQHPSTIYQTCGTYTVTLTVTNGSGQVSTITHSVIIHCKPTASFSFPSSIGCAPVGVAFNSTSTSGGAGFTNYTWDFGDGVGGAGSNPSHNYISPGCKSVTLVVTDANGCLDDTTVANAICPAVPPIADFTSTPSVACAAPLTVAYTSVNPGANGPYTYAWIFQGGSPAISTAQNPSITYSTPGAYYAQLIVTAPNGCADTIKKNNYVIIGANAANFSLSALTGCAPFTVYCALSPNSQAISVQWTAVGGNSGTPNNSDNLITFNNSGTYQICVTVTFPGNCVATKCTTIVVGATPVAAFSVSGLSNVCQPPLNNIQFTNLSTGGATYQWSFPGGTPVSSTSFNPPNVNYTQCGVYDVTLVVTSSQGCTDTLTMDSLIQINCPIANFVASGMHGCIPFDVTFNSTGSFGNPVAWAWNFGDVGNGNLVQSTQQNPTHTYTASGCYNVRLIITNAQGCKDTLKLLSYVCAGTQPNVDFSATPLNACIGDVITFTNLSTGIFPTTNYSWDFNGGPPFSTMSSLKNPTYTYTDTGYFDVALIACNNGCCDTIIKTDYIHINPPLAKITVDRSCINRFDITLHGETSIGADTYSWSIPGGTPNSSNSPIVSVHFNSTGIYTATLTVTNIASGCSNTATQVIQIRNVNADFVIVPQQGCSPFNFCINNLSTDANTYNWLIWNVATNVSYFFGTAANPCPTLQLPGIYSVRLIATDVNGCKDTITKPNYLTVYGSIANFSASVTQGCAPLFATFTDLSTSATGFVVGWSWDFGDPSSGALNFSSLQNPTHIYANGGMYSVTLAVTDNHGCVNVKNTNSNFITVGHPNIDFEANDSSVCLGTPICFINNTTDVIGFPSYSWNFGDGVGTSALPVPCYTYTDTGTYSVTLIAQDWWGCKDTLTLPQYIHISTPNSNFVADTTVSVCPPLQVNFSNLSLGADSSDQYLWDFGDGATSTSFNAFHIYTTAGQFSVTLTLTTANGCVSTLTFTNYINITGPSATVNVTPITGCAPQSVCFYALSGNTSSYIWNFGDGNVDLSNTDTICYTYNVPGFFYPAVILSDGAGCTYTLPLDSIIVSHVTAGFALSTNDLCNSGSINFTDTSSSILTVSSWSWNFGDPASGGANTSTLQNPNHLFNAPGTYIVTLTAKDNLLCQTTFTDTVFVHQLPDAQFTINTSPICPGGSITFTSTSTSFDQITTYQWNFGDAASGVLNSASTLAAIHTYNTAGTYSVKLKVFTAYGCSDSLVQTITVNVPPTANAGPDQNICINSAAQLSASGGLSYLWNPAATLTSPTTSNPSALPLVSTTYSVVVTDANGCSKMDSMTVTVHNYPGITAGPDQTICIGSATPITATGGTGYLWSPSTGLNASVGATVSANPTVTTSYSVIGTDVWGCTNSDQIVINIVNAPIVSAGTDTAVCNGESVQLNATGGISYSWSPGANLTATNIFNPLATPVNTITYTVTITDANGCSANDAIAITVLPLPLANAGIDQDICINFTAQLNATGGTSYLWSPNLTLSDSIINNPVSSTLATTTYAVLVTGANGCTASDSMTVTVHNTPIISAGSDATICYGTSTVLQAIGGTIYNWTPFTALNNAGIAAPTASPTVTTYYVVQGISSWGCINYDTVTVNVLAPPPAYAGTDTAICYLQSTTLHATGGIGYSWAPANSLNNSLIPDPLASPSATVDYIVSVTDANGCVATDTVNVIVHPLPSINAGPDMYLCLGTPLQMSVTGGIAYQWSPAQDLDDSTLANPTTITTVTTNYIVTGQDNIGCSNSDSVLVTVIYPLTATANAEVDVCEGLQTQLSASGGAFYQWSPSIGLDNPNIPNPSCYVGQTTSFMVIVSDGICFPDTAYTMVVVHQLPQVNAGDDQVVLAGDNVPLNGWGTGVSYNWAPPQDIDCAYCLNTTAHPMITTTYTLWITNDFGCQASDDVVIKVGCTDDVVYVPNAFSPNDDGNNDQLFVRSRGLKVLNYFRVYDRWGSLVFESHDMSSGWDGKVRDKISMPGVYVWYMEGSCANGQKVELQGNVTLVR